MATRDKKFEFDVAPALKELLRDPLESWMKRHGGDLTELAEKCGVTPAYLGHVRRYGRVPSRPVLILLALNLKIDGDQLFRAIDSADVFPYEAKAEIIRPDVSADSIFSIKFNMDSFSEAIRGIVRSEVRTRSIRDLLGDRPLRIGLNYNLHPMFNSYLPPADGNHSGIFPEFCKMLGLALQKEVQLIYVPFAEYMPRFLNGQLDIFGPTMVVPNLPSHINFTTPLYRLGISALFRKRVTPDLATLELPTTVETLRDERYKIAVLKNSLPHLICNTLLKRSDDSLIITSSDEEGIDRLIVRGINRAAHVFVTNGATAVQEAKKHPKELQAIFATKDTALDVADSAIAVRPDWPEVIPVLNEAIRFVQRRGGFEQRLRELQKGELAGVLRLPSE